ncbi:MAG: hypothetical protein M1834_007685 [Cirrosporium novae-zelandiae]|nr:MAG: hypothetical protein M1834_007685 [Cirrosporium novae-zelandiae]
MTSDENLLETVAKDGSMDYSQWPGLLDRLLSRLHHIVYTEFPIPPYPSSEPAPSQVIDSDSSISEPQSAVAQNKENAPPPSPAGRPPVPLFSDPPREDRASSSHSVRPEPTLPPPLLDLLSSVETTIKKQFADTPPYTIQRFAELLLEPRNHYRTLPAYLRALDRVVSVTSGADLFPLPYITQQQPTLPVEEDQSNGRFLEVLNPSLGSDESLGGALLTPIPWLHQSETASGDGGSDSMNEESAMATDSIINGVSNGVSQRASGGVTQGELLRQEQEAGVVPLAQTTSVRGTVNPDNMSDQDDLIEEVEERPHVRGPQEVGMEDTGPQGTERETREFNAEAAVGRTVSRPKSDEAMQEEKPAESDAGVMVVDGDGKTQFDETRADTSGQSIGADAIDSTAL